MKIFRDLEAIGGIRNPVVTTGSFDGVHLGHTVILKRLNQLARELDGESVLITFHPHPRKVLYPETAGKELLLINSQQEKIELLESVGLDNLIIINFTIEFSKTTSIDFIRKILVGKLNARCIVVGFNHHFGHNREGSFEYLYELGRYYNFLVEEIPEQDIENETVSSTRIRQSLLEGKIQRANAYLDHLYMIKAPLREDNTVFGNAGYPGYLVEIEEDVKLIPPAGTYAVQLEVKGLKYKGIVVITSHQTHIDDHSDKRVEVHLFEHEGNLKGQTVKILFHKQIRDGEVKVQLPADQKALERDILLIQDLIY